MESFVLSETLKVVHHTITIHHTAQFRDQYLYLLFDEDNRLHDDDSNYVFTTEGHILRLDKDHIRPNTPKSLRKFVSHQCPAYTPFAFPAGDAKTLSLTRGVRFRPDTEYARALVGNNATDADKRYWDIDGWCEKPKPESYVSPNTCL